MPDSAAPQSVTSDELESTVIELRLEGIKEALSRSRVAFLATTIISLMMILGTWNSYFSWDRSFAELPYWADKEKHEKIIQNLRSNWEKTGGTRDGTVAYLKSSESPACGACTLIVQFLDNKENWPGDNKQDEVLQKLELLGERAMVTDFLQKQWIEAWIKNQQISVPLLGISVSSSDATFLASVALVVAMIWFFWCTRRENHSIAQLLRETANSSPSLKRLVFHGIAANLVFISLTNDDSAQNSIEPKPGKTSYLMRRLVRALSYLPPFAILFCGGVQLIYVMKTSPFRTGIPIESNPLYVAFVSAIAVAAIVITLLVGYRANLFQNGIMQMMRAFFRELSKPANKPE